MTNLLTGSLLAMICGGLFALALGAIGVFLLLQYSQQQKKAQQSTNWPSVEGRIIDHRVRVDEVSDDDGTRVSYVPEVKFEYRVDGTTYQGKRVAFGSEPSFGSRKKAEAFLESYPAQSTISVFFNPENHQEAVLSQTMRKMTASLIVGIVLIVVGVCSLCPVVMGLVRTFLS